MSSPSLGQASVRSWGAELAQPIPLLAVALLVVNDHYLKRAGIAPGWLTGKLSDVAGLFFFPLLLTALLGWSLQRARPSLKLRTPILAAFSVALTAIAFSLIKTVPCVNAWACALLGVMVLDPSDLVALPALGLSYLWQVRRVAPVRGGWARSIAIAAAAFASLGTSQMRMSREFPGWEFRAPSTRRLGCAQVQAWVAKSGKQGLGLMLELRNPAEQSCSLTLADARLRVGPLVVLGVQQRPFLLQRGAVQQLYVPFEFDNEALWNDGQHSGSLQLLFRGDGLPTEELWHIPLEHVMQPRSQDVPQRPTPVAPSSSGPTIVRPPLEIAE
jgi:hypothetical protein